MLVLSRKKGETLVIDNNIELTILEVDGENIKLGINAPQNIKIYRKEIYEEIQKANQEALQSQKINNNELLQLLKSKDQQKKR